MTKPVYGNIISLCVSLLLSFSLLSSCRDNGLLSTQIDLRGISDFPQRVNIAGREYELTASAFRDYMPPAPPDGKPLLVVICVTAVDSLQLPLSLNADRVWVANGGEIWSAELNGEVRRDRPYLFYKAADGGPKWGPGIYVDVFARIIDGGESHILEVHGVYIGMVS